MTFDQSGLAGSSFDHRFCPRAPNPLIARLLWRPLGVAGDPVATGPIMPRLGRTSPRVAARRAEIGLGAGSCDGRKPIRASGPGTRTALRAEGGRVRAGWAGAR